MKSVLLMLYGFTVFAQESGHQGVLQSIHQKRAQMSLLVTSSSDVDESSVAERDSEPTCKNGGTAVNCKEIQTLLGQSSGIVEVANLFSLFTSQLQEPNSDQCRCFKKVSKKMERLFFDDTKKKKNKKQAQEQLLVKAKQDLYSKLLSQWARHLEDSSYFLNNHPEQFKEQKNQSLLSCNDFKLFKKHTPRKCSFSEKDFLREINPVMKKFGMTENPDFDGFMKNFETKIYFQEIAGKGVLRADYDQLRGDLVKTKEDNALKSLARLIFRFKHEINLDQNVDVTQALIQLFEKKMQFNEGQNLSKDHKLIAEFLNYTQSPFKKSQSLSVDQLGEIYFAQESGPKQLVADLNESLNRLSYYNPGLALIIKDKNLFKDIIAKSESSDDWLQRIDYSNEIMDKHQNRCQDIMERFAKVVCMDSKQFDQELGSTALFLLLKDQQNQLSDEEKFYATKMSCESTFLQNRNKGLAQWPVKMDSSNLSDFYLTNQDANSKEQSAFYQFAKMKIDSDLSEDGALKEYFSQVDIIDNIENWLTSAGSADLAKFPGLSHGFHKYSNVASHFSSPGNNTSVNTSPEGNQYSPPAPHQRHGASDIMAPPFPGYQPLQNQTPAMINPYKQLDEYLKKLQNSNLSPLERETALKEVENIMTSPQYEQNQQLKDILERYKNSLKEVAQLQKQISKLEKELTDTKEQTVESNEKSLLNENSSAKNESYPRNYPTAGASNNISSMSNNKIVNNVDTSNTIKPSSSPFQKITQKTKDNIDLYLDYIKKDPQMKDQTELLKLLKDYFVSWDEEKQIGELVAQIDGQLLRIELNKANIDRLSKEFKIEEKDLKFFIKEMNQKKLGTTPELHYRTAIQNIVSEVDRLQHNLAKVEQKNESLYQEFIQSIGQSLDSP